MWGLYLINKLQISEHCASSGVSNAYINGGKWIVPWIHTGSAMFLPLTEWTESTSDSSPLDEIYRVPPESLCSRTYIVPYSASNDYAFFIPQ